MQREKKRVFNKETILGHSETLQYIGLQPDRSAFQEFLSENVKNSASKKTQSHKIKVII